MNKTPSISRIGFAQFRIFWPGVPSSAMALDFRPLIEALKLSGDYILIHWQAQPYGLRQWGLYLGASDEYVSDIGGDFPEGYQWSRAQLNENLIKTKPIAVIIGKKIDESRPRPGAGGLPSSESTMGESKPRLQALGAREGEAHSRADSAIAS